MFTLGHSQTLTLILAECLVLGSLTDLPQIRS